MIGSPGGKGAANGHGTARQGDNQHRFSSYVSLFIAPSRLSLPPASSLAPSQLPPLSPEQGLGALWPHSSIPQSLCCAQFRSGLGRVRGWLIAEFSDFACVRVCVYTQWISVKIPFRQIIQAPALTCLDMPPSVFPLIETGNARMLESQGMSGNNLQRTVLPTGTVRIRSTGEMECRCALFPDTLQPLC